MAVKIGFYKGNGHGVMQLIVHFLIRLRTWGKYTHVELIDDGGSKDMSDWVWYGATTRNPGGTAKRHIEFHYKNWDIFELSKEVEYQPAFTWMDRHLGHKYDWLGIWFYQFLRIRIESPQNFFCSEYIAGALQNTDLMKEDKAAPTSYSPHKLYKKLLGKGIIH